MARVDPHGGSPNTSLPSRATGCSRTTAPRQPRRSRAGAGSSPLVWSRRRHRSHQCQRPDACRDPPRGGQHAGRCALRHRRTRGPRGMASETPGDRVDHPIEPPAPLAPRGQCAWIAPRDRSPEASGWTIGSTSGSPGSAQSSWRATTCTPARGSGRLSVVERAIGDLLRPPTPQTASRPVKSLPGGAGDGLRAPRARGGHGHHCWCGRPATGSSTASRARRRHSPASSPGSTVAPRRAAPQPAPVDQRRLAPHSSPSRASPRQPGSPES